LIPKTSFKKHYLLFLRRIL